MAVAGVDLWLIQAFCRWGSEAVLGYVRDCQLMAAVGMSRQVAKGLQLAEVRGSIYQRVEEVFGEDAAEMREPDIDEALEAQFVAVGIEGLQGEPVAESLEGCVHECLEGGVELGVGPSGS